MDSVLDRWRIDSRDIYEIKSIGLGKGQYLRSENKDDSLKKKKRWFKGIKVLQMDMENIAHMDYFSFDVFFKQQVIMNCVLEKFTRFVPLERCKACHGLENAND